MKWRSVRRQCAALEDTTSGERDFFHGFFQVGAQLPPAEGRSFIDRRQRRLVWSTKEGDPIMRTDPVDQRNECQPPPWASMRLGE